MTKTSGRETCVSCANVDHKTHLRAAPCGHHYCGSCLKRMARLTLTDRALVPLRCCRKELPIEYVAFGFSQSQSSMRRTKDFAAYERLLNERKREWKNSDLVSDAEYAHSVRTVGAKQCPDCGIGVQRDYGCIHMTCACGHQFCFTCLSAWGSCHCVLIPDEEVRQILGE